MSFNDGYGSSSVKLAGDISGDGKADVVCTKVTDVHVAKSSGSAFGADAVAFNKNYASNTNGWFSF